jgi:FkbM family methyltransferase
MSAARWNVDNLAADAFRPRQLLNDFELLLVMNLAAQVRSLGHQFLPPVAVKTARKVVRKLNDPIQARHDQELSRLRKLPEGEPNVTNIFGWPFHTLGGRSFAHLYDLFFRKEFYSFKCSTDTPYIIDCGANVGVSVVWWKTKYPRARVLAFEADPKIFRLLQINCGHLDGVDLINAALWNEDGKIGFAALGGEGGHVAAPSANSTSVRSVPCVRLRSFLQEKCDLLKMDIEGAEVEVIRDSVDVLNRVDRAFIEYHSFAKRSQFLGETIARLEAVGFRLYVHTELPSARPFEELVVFNDKDLHLDLFCYRETTRPCRVEALPD